MNSQRVRQSSSNRNQPNSPQPTRLSPNSAPTRRISTELCPTLSNSAQLSPSSAELSTTQPNSAKLSLILPNSTVFTPIQLKSPSAFARIRDDSRLIDAFARYSLLVQCIRKVWFRRFSSEAKKVELAARIAAIDV